ncbi:N-acetylglucosamine-6-phosphate deacetylase [Mycoplasmopsis canis]|uniref:N-acetylglucosamine-6-phosphate deacetylase n=1 Tax=Mycoplasmopsis canis TaxID=29555 RepID=UPI00025AF024|nr:N-acetylglucosamine-6-phosphate deacetylase [Mycoplasmopsis canis]EIE40146.1 N-acetylglucosamine-6-phosphate deacetylase [Mycoplasmopsis canis UF33]EIE41500.1 N-acetylglucosamine-6-phosphate deacetylase [Mycoplasmopsis canis UFG1]
METIISNVKIVNHDETINNADIIIENNYIKSIIKKSGEGTRIAVPGFIDTHIHGLYNYDVMEGSKALEIISYQLAKNGTTSFMPTAMTNSWKNILSSLSNMSENKVWYSRNLGFHIEGPFIGLAKKGAHKPEYLLKANKSKIHQLVKASNFNLKKISFDPKMMSLKTFDYLKDQWKIIGSIGHTDASYKMSQDFFDRGCNMVCHLWNAMSGVDSRNPGLAQAALANDNVYTEVIIDLVHSSKETIHFTIKNKTADKVIAVSDAIKPAYYMDGENISGDTKVFKKGKLITLAGTNTIAGSGIVIHDSFVNLVKIGYSLNDAVKITSYNAAKHLGHNKIGQLKENYFADIVLMNPKSLKIKTVYVDGKKVR